MARRNDQSSQSTPATAVLDHAGVTYTRHSYTHDPRAVAEGGSYGLEAAAALGLAPQTVFKTLLVTVEGAPRPGLAVAIVPVTHLLDLKAVAMSLGEKRAAMADVRVAERTTGYVVGGISPLGQRSNLPSVLDSSAAEHPTIYVSGGRRGLDLGLSPTDLIRLSGAVLFDITR